jgi:hypothetical protein
LNSRESGNGIKSVSKTGDTLNLNNGSFVIIPGISEANSNGGGGKTTIAACLAAELPLRGRLN